MLNVQHEVKGDKLIITVDVSKKLIENAPMTKSGKNKNVASTEGFTSVNGNGLRFGLNVISK